MDRADGTGRASGSCDSFRDRILAPCDGRQGSRTDPQHIPPPGSRGIGDDHAGCPLGIRIPYRGGWPPSMPRGGVWFLPAVSDSIFLAEYGLFGAIFRSIRPLPISGVLPTNFFSEFRPVWGRGARQFSFRERFGRSWKEEPSGRSVKAMEFRRISSLSRRRGEWGGAAGSCVGSGGQAPAE